ncbi:MAG: toxin-activating lysine-acyltransferase [Proteobacteria bacterium]|nr:MAG: toxin-activating lysine-acyltransferase [Pseudomonadota bacterium]
MDENRHAEEPLSTGGQLLAERLPYVGHAVWLCARSPAHRCLFVQDLDWRVIPPIMLNQYRLYFDNESARLPVAFASWACLSERAERDYVATQRIAPTEWNSGDRLWLVDIVAPFGGSRQCLSDLHHDTHRGREVNVLYPDEHGVLAPTALKSLVPRRRDPAPAPAH